MTVSRALILTALTVTGCGGAQRGAPATHPPSGATTRTSATATSAPSPRVRVRAAGRLPAALHDAGVDQVLRIRADGRTSRAAKLPAGASDVAAARVARTAYVVGGYTGTIALRTIVAYIPGQQPRTVARLPQPPRLRAALTHAGRLPVALSDVGAASVSRRIVALGGRDRTGRVHDAILSLTAQP